MKLRATIAAIVLAGAASGSAVMLSSGTPADASTSANVRTCAAFRQWDRHHSTENLNAMLTESEYAPWKLAGTDAVVLYTDVRAKMNTTDDIAAFRQDCKHVH